MHDTTMYDALAEVGKPVYRLPALATFLGRSENELWAAIARHEAWRALDPDARGAMPDDVLMAFNVKGDWFVPTTGAQRYVDPARFAAANAARGAARKQAACERAEALDAPTVVAAAQAEIARLLPGVAVTSEPVDGVEYEMMLPHRFAVSLVEGDTMLVGTLAYTVGAALPHLVDLAAVERLRRDIAAAGWAVRIDHQLPHGIFATAPDGAYWYIDLDLPEDGTDPFWHHDRGSAGVASVAWDYGAQGAAIVPAALLTKSDAIATLLARLRVPGLMSATQAEDVAARVAVFAASQKVAAR